MSSTTSTAHRSYAARLPAGTENPVTMSKHGVYHTQRMPDGRVREIMACGLACSECFSGATLHKVLQSGWEYETAVMEKLAAGAAAPPLSIHTSNGVPAAMGPFLAALSVHLPWPDQQDLDWCVSLQIEGASAVWAAIDMLLQVNSFEGGDPKRIKVAVGATSYHGPPTTSFGSRSAIWPKEQQIMYPVPLAAGTPYNEAELLQTFQTFLDTYADQVGVILFEPQWGSSQAAFPWPQHLLKQYISLAKERGIKVLCDEIMCGLGRHGQGTLFISSAWDLNPDAITFGKAVATGVFQLSGAILKQGRDILAANNCTVLQSHTYAGSSIRALMAATEVLKELVVWLPHVSHRGDEMAQIMGHLTQISNGLFVGHGQGLMWGAIITHTGRCSSVEYRTRVREAFVHNCHEALVLPYFVPIGGFMITPVIDIDAAAVAELGARLERAIVRTMTEVGWPAAAAPTVLVAEVEEDVVKDDALLAAHLASATLAKEQHEEATLIMSETVA